MDNHVLSNLIKLTLAVCLALIILLMIVNVVLAVMMIVVVILVLMVLYRFSPRMHDGIDTMLEPIKRMWRKFTRNNGSTLLDTKFRQEYVLEYMEHGRVKHRIIDKERFTIGHNAKCDLVLHDWQVTAEHCVILYRKYSHEYYIEDQNSLNGTFLGTHHLEPYTQEKLLDNAEIVIVGHTFRFVRMIERPSDQQKS